MVYFFTMLLAQSPTINPDDVVATPTSGLMKMSNGQMMNASLMNTTSNSTVNATNATNNTDTTQKKTIGNTANLLGAQSILFLAATFS